MQAEGRGGRRLEDHLVGKFRIGKIHPGGRGGPAVIGKQRGVIGDPGHAHVDTDGHVVLHPGCLVDFGKFRAVLELFTQAEADGAVHDAIVEEHQVHLRRILCSGRLGENIAGCARHDDDLHVIGLFEGREDSLGERAFQIAAVHPDIKGFGFGMGRTGNGQACDAGGECRMDGFHHSRSP
ncbi:hypothetical protein D3C80_734090 [compost metagenome]